MWDSKQASQHDQMVWPQHTARHGASQCARGALPAPSLHRVAPGKRQDNVPHPPEPYLPHNRQVAHGATSPVASCQQLVQEAAGSCSGRSAAATATHSVCGVLAAVATVTSECGGGERACWGLVHRPTKRLIPLLVLLLLLLQRDGSAACVAFLLPVVDEAEARVQQHVAGLRVVGVRGFCGKRASRQGEGGKRCGPRKMCVVNRRGNAWATQWRHKHEACWCGVSANASHKAAKASS